MTQWAGWAAPAACGRTVRGGRRTPRRGRWPVRRGRPGRARSAVGRDEQPQTGVPVLVFVPAEEGLTVHASRFDRGEAGGEVGPVLQRLELGLGVWVVIAHVRSGVGLGDPEVGEQQGDRLGMISYAVFCLKKK